jgi:hypothetical protein
MEQQGVHEQYVLPRYQAFTEHRKHTDQVRQLLLYNFLMGGTILVLGWTALYAAQRSVWARVLLGALSGLAAYCRRCGFILQIARQPTTTCMRRRVV